MVYRAHKCGHTSLARIITYESSPAGNPGHPPGALFADRASWYITELEYLATPLVAAARGFGGGRGPLAAHTHTHYIIIIVFTECHITSATTTHYNTRRYYYYYYYY